MQIESSYWLRRELRVKRFRVHDFIFLYIFFFLAFPLLFAEARGRAFPSRLLEEFHSETPDVREWNGDLCVALPFQHLYHLARSLIFHPVMETQDE